MRVDHTKSNQNKNTRVAEMDGSHEIRAASGQLKMESAQNRNFSRPEVVASRVTDVLKSCVHHGTFLIFFLLLIIMSDGCVYISFIPL